MAKWSVWLAVVFLGGCSNFLYQGSLTAPDSQGAPRKAILYWYKTEPLLGDAKAGPASLMTECGATLTFEERPQGLIFRGEAGRDRLPGSAQPLTDGAECGRIVDAASFVALKDGTVRVKILCEPVAGDEFSVVTRRYLKASDAPYAFEVDAQKRWSLFGTTIPAPAPPECRRQ